MTDTMEKKIDEVFCSSCGAIIKKEAEICPKCGVRQFTQNDTSENSKQGLAIASLILGIACFIVPFIGLVGGVIGLIFGIIALQNDKKGMAVAGIILNSLGLLGSIILFILFVIGIGMASSTLFDIFNYF